MSTETAATGVDSQEKADFEAVLRHALNGTPLDPDVARRVEERAARALEEMRRVHGEIPEGVLNQLLRDARDDT